LALNVPGERWYRMPIAGLVEEFLKGKLKPMEEEGAFNLDPRYLGGPVPMGTVKGRRGRVILVCLSFPGCEPQADHTDQYPRRNLVGRLLATRHRSRNTGLGQCDLYPVSMGLPPIVRHVVGNGRTLDDRQPSRTSPFPPLPSRQGNGDR
jgi:hypothetical protein